MQIMLAEQETCGKEQCITWEDEADEESRLRKENGKYGNNADRRRGPFDEADSVR